MTQGYDKNNFVKNDIVINHTQIYMKRMSLVLLFSLLAVTIAETIILILIKHGHFQYYLYMQNNIPLTYNALLFEVIVHNSLLWVFYGLYILFSRKSSYKTNKILYSITVMIIVTILCFGHWKYSYLSILYCIPVCVSSPLGKIHHTVVFIISLIITIFYSIFQAFYFGTEYNFLIGVVSVLALIVFYMISRIFFSCMINAMIDISKYSDLTIALKQKVHHDSLTGAYSKIALVKDFDTIQGFNSIAFLDLDNFKQINDEYGHSVGDYILKNLVRCFKIKNERIYRYGGDEFVVLSNLSVQKFEKELLEIKNNFSNVGSTVLNLKTSFSAGVIPISSSDNINTLLKKCDKVMYMAKNCGKDKITCEYDNSKLEV